MYPQTMYPQMFSVPGKRTKRSITGTKHGRFEKKFPTLGKKKKKKKIQISVGTWWFLVADQCCVVFQLIKSLPSKRISQIRLDRNKIKKKKKRSVRIEEDEERKKKKRKKLKRMIEQRDLPRRGQSRAQSWEAWGEGVWSEEQRDEMGEFA